ncbi:hypothetical protein FA740_14320 [Paracoccus hibiscisoli]|uniref:ABC transporter domain-containing protein n=1 Tax=Paracoccus hibiscisoli TaxID=2023261 RepID=A0A4U0QMS8_9RHOB|nr:hypothetical protein FA740_14320 [Paracoccus hibiscisoli]
MGQAGGRRAHHPGGADCRALPSARPERTGLGRGRRRPYQHPCPARQDDGDPDHGGGHGRIGRRVGVIGFVGIVVPHLLRLVQGPDHRWLLIATGLLGATAPVAADMVSRSVIAPLELPIGIITAMIGGPACLWVLLYGSGKTILLRDLTTEIAPARGRVTLNGRAIAGQSPAALPRRRAVLPQQSALSFAFTAAEIVGIGLDPLPLEGVRG